MRTDDRDERGRFEITFGLSFLHTLVSEFHAKYFCLITTKGKVSVFYELCQDNLLTKEKNLCPRLHHLKKKKKIKDCKSDVNL